MLKILSLMVVLVVYSSYSYSEDITPYYGTTGNAAAGGHSWSMGTVLPTPPGLDINTVIYDYTIQKDVDDSVNVHVQNENASGSGYIFRETDEWQSGSLGGTEIRKVVPVIPNIPRAAWGDGSIEVDGNGFVEDARVVYSYKIDPCYDPQFDPNCPGYVTPRAPEIEFFDVSTIYDATKDENVNLSSEEQVLLEENEEILEDKEEEDEEEEEKRKREYRLEMLADSNASQLFAENQRIEQMNRAMQVVVNTQYSSRLVPGGEYNDTITLLDSELNDSKSGLRNGLAQQILHEKMISMQYTR